MLIDGVRVDLSAVHTVVIPRPGGGVRVKIGTLPYNLDLDDYVPPPAPDEIVKRDDHGRPVRDKNGGPVIVANDRDPGFLRRINAWTRLRRAAIVYFATRQAQSVKFESVAGDEPDKNPEAFFAKVADELNACGFTQGDVELIAAKALKLSNQALGELDLEDYLSDFSPEENSRPGSGTPCGRGKAEAKAAPSSTLSSPPPSGSASED